MDPQSIFRQNFVLEGVHRLDDVSKAGSLVKVFVHSPRRGCVLAVDSGSMVVGVVGVARARVVHISPCESFSLFQLPSYTRAVTHINQHFIRYAILSPSHRALLNRWAGDCKIENLGSQASSEPSKTLSRSV